MVEISSEAWYLGSSYQGRKLHGLDLEAVEKTQLRG